MRHLSFLDVELKKRGYDDTEPSNEFMSKVAAEAKEWKIKERVENMSFDELYAECKRRKII
jgi:hypothetical protein